MKRLLLSAAALAAFAVPAFAADPVAEEAVDIWSGYFVGIAGGYTFKDVTWDIDNGNEVGDFESDDFIVGAYYGRNWQSGNLVFGLDSSFNYIGLDEDNILAGILLAPVVNVEANFLGLSRLKVGYAFDHTMIFAAGGLATTHIDVENTTDGVDDDDWAFGWTVGAGVEHKFSDNWSARIEYAYFNIESDDLDFDGTLEATYELEGHIIRGGVAYHF